MRHSRRSLLGVVSGVLATAVAGCSSPDDDGGSDQCVETEPNYRGWFDGVSNYRCTVDRRTDGAVTIMVGTQGNSGYYKFDPPAVAIAPETTVTWEWTGKGGTHNVVSRTGLFDSGRPVDQRGHTFTHTFERPGIYYYLCEPHESLGMRGTVFVSLEP